MDCIKHLEANNESLRAEVKALRGDVEELYIGEKLCGMIADLINASLSEVNWAEIVSAHVEEEENEVRHGVAGKGESLSRGETGQKP